MKSEARVRPHRNRHLTALAALAGWALVSAACSGGGSSGGSATGGTTGSGGSATGGTTGSGGSATGGTTSSGGSATSGITSSGGSATGGITSSGGSATGGSTSSGGSATGGSATGGSATGGRATGGSTTDGSATGGSATGGSTTDGSAADGSATGGRATGGSATGGSATGGSATGGSATGGTTGGGATGGSTGGTADAGSDTTLSCTIDGDCCPNDLNKTQPGICGCGVSDEDSDEDGTPDCNDLCITDRQKTEPGVCGCNGRDIDTDGDGTLDCEDLCPREPARAKPGACGCALPDTAAPYCLAHRYGFGDSGTTVTDSVGKANGKAMNVTLPGTGSLTLAGGTSDQYVQLPSGVISGLGHSATIEAWITWNGSAYWERVFDFGTNENGATGGQGSGTASLFFTPLGGAAGEGVPTLSVNSGGLTEVTGTTAFPQGGQPHHVACIIDGASSDANANSASLYIDGKLIQKKTPLQSTLSGLTDVNNWLGRSQFATDPEFTGTYHELRIYSAALSQSQITANVAAGPDRLP